MKPLVLIFLHSLLFLACNGQMMGGLPAGPRQFPFAVQVLSNVSGYTSVCAGSIIGRQWVLTAGHCVRRNGANLITKIVAGDEFYKDSDGVGRVEIRNDQIQIITPVRFDRDDNTYDAALLFLRTPLEASRRVKMIELGTRVIQIGEECTVMGWGNTRVVFGPPGSDSNHVQSEISTFLKYGKLTVQHNGYPHFYVTEFMNRDGVSPYMTKGDSGSPLVCRDTDGKQKLFGWLYIVEADHNLAVYKKLAFFREWIRGQMRMKGILNEYEGGVTDFRKFNP